MCTALVRYDPGAAWPLLVAFVRDEDRGRETLAPDTWWPEQPTVIAARDARAGGTWLALDARDGDGTSRIAFVQNQIGPHVSFPNADSSPSRGQLPLVALAESGFDAADIAGLKHYQPFHLVLATPGESHGVDWWQWNGTRLDHVELQAGMHLVASRGLELGGERERRATLLARFAQAATPDPDPALDSATAWTPWLELLDGRAAQPDDLGGLVVHSVTQRPGFGTVGATLVAIAADGRTRYDVNDTTSLSPDAWTQVTIPSPSVAGR